jgi:hypothetical protein
LVLRVPKEQGPCHTSLEVVGECQGSTGSVRNQKRHEENTGTRLYHDFLRKGEIE